MVEIGKDKPGTALVTGASSGLGKVYADRLAQRGFDLILVARRGDRLDAVAQALRGLYGVGVETIVADLGMSADVDAVAAAIAGHAGLTMLVNNAGTSTFGMLNDVTAAQSDAMNDLNVTALVRLSLAALRAFKQRDRGTIVNIGSVLGFHTLPFSSIYSGTKGYVQNFTRGLQAEVEGSNVVVQLVAPATTATEIWDISGVPLSQLDPKTIMSAEDCVDAALAGLDQGELFTLPSVEDYQLYLDYETARTALLGASQSGKPASRYTMAR